MEELKLTIIEILKKELKRLSKVGVKHLGYRYFLNNGKSLGYPTIDLWRKPLLNKDFYIEMKSYLSEEILNLTRNKFSYVTRASDHGNNKYLLHLKKLGLSNSVGIYIFNSNRIDSFFFICEPEQGKQRDLLINNIHLLEYHVNSLKNQMDQISHKLKNIEKPDFFIDNVICKEIFLNISSCHKGSSKYINIIYNGHQIEINSRELEVLSLLKFGEGNKSIAFKLGINEKTVERVLFLLKQKFNTNCKNRLITIALSPQLQYVLK